MTRQKAGCMMGRIMNNREHRSSGTPDIPTRLLALARLCIPGTYIVLTVSFAVMILGAAGAIYGLWYVIDRWLPDVHSAVLLIPGIASLAGIGFALSGTIRSFRVGPQFAPALRIDLNAEPRLKNLLDETSVMLRTLPPDTVVLHADANFFVQQGALAVFNGEARGRILAMSLPLLSFISTAELRAILAHELAHFTGKDEVFSATVIPAYTKLARSIQVMSAILGAAPSGSGHRRNPGWLGVPLIFPWFLLNLYWTAFHRLNVRISRTRERRADVMAALACGSTSLSSALRKVAALRRLFPDIFKKTFADRVRWGLTFANYCQLFRDAVPGLEEAVEAPGNSPPDSSELDEAHPPLPERLAYIPATAEIFQDNGPAREIMALTHYEEQMTAHLITSLAPQVRITPSEPPNEELPEGTSLETDDYNIPDPAYAGDEDDTEGLPAESAPGTRLEREENQTR